MNLPEIIFKKTILHWEEMGEVAVIDKISQDEQFMAGGYLKAFCAHSMLVSQKVGDRNESEIKFRKK